MRNLYVVEGGKVNLEEFEHKPKIGEMTEKENIRLIVNNQGKSLVRDIRMTLIL